MLLHPGSTWSSMLPTSSHSVQAPPALLASSCSVDSVPIRGADNHCLSLWCFPASPVFKKLDEVLLLAVWLLALHFPQWLPQNARTGCSIIYAYPDAMGWLSTLFLPLDPYIPPWGALHRVFSYFSLIQNHLLINYLCLSFFQISEIDKSALMCLMSWRVYGFNWFHMNIKETWPLHFDILISSLMFSLFSVGWSSKIPWAFPLYQLFSQNKGPWHQLSFHFFAYGAMYSEVLWFGLVWFGFFCFYWKPWNY